jgi:8-oxo-dGTP pyrophosphatase MutT (NUDIX family)
MNFFPDVTVAAIAVRDERFLMIEEMVSGSRVINQPAGHLDNGESLIEAVVRETIEETAWRFVPQAFLGVYQWRNLEIDRTFIRFAFVGRCDTHYPDRELDDGICTAIWMTRNEILAESDRLRSPMVMQCIDDLVAGRRYPLEVLVNLPFITDLSLQELNVSSI